MFQRIGKVGAVCQVVWNLKRNEGWL